MTITQIQGKHFLNSKHFGEMPQNQIEDSYSSIEVEMIQWSNPEETYKTMYNFIMGTYGTGRDFDKTKIYTPSKKEIEDVVKAACEGEALPLALEIPNFTFRISGIDRIITHQIVRSRIGVTFSQHCTGDNDIRHSRLLVPYPILESKEKGISGRLLREIVKEHLKKAMNTYALLLDKGISIQDARHILPQCVDTYIFMHCNFFMLLGFFARRMCTNETFQMQKICKLIRQEVKREFPLLAKYLKGGCDSKKKCHFKKNDSIFAGSIFPPCGKHNRYSRTGKTMKINPRQFIHGNKTAFEMRTIRSEAETEV